MNCIPQRVRLQHQPPVPGTVALFGSSLCSYDQAIKLRYGGTKLGWVLRPAISVLIRRGRLGHRGSGTQRECLVTREAERRDSMLRDAKAAGKLQDYVGWSEPSSFHSRAGSPTPRLGLLISGIYSEG